MNGFRALRHYQARDSILSPAHGEWHGIRNMNPMIVDLVQIGLEWLSVDDDSGLEPISWEALDK